MLKNFNKQASKVRPEAFLPFTAYISELIQYLLNLLTRAPKFWQHITKPKICPNF